MRGRTPVRGLAAAGPGQSPRVAAVVVTAPSGARPRWREGGEPVPGGAEASPEAGDSGRDAGRALPWSAWPRISAH